jgi:hypothetical protein
MKLSRLLALAGALTVAHEHVVAGSPALPLFGPPKLLVEDSLGVSQGDFDGDGRPDLLVSSISSGPELLLNAGGGSFRPPLVIPVRSGATSIGPLGDFNSDGHLDFVLLRGMAVSLVLGDGKGGFSETPDFDAGTLIDRTASADFDRDGKLDLVVVGLDPANHDKSFLTFLRGDGAGGFAPPVRSEIPRQLYSDAVAADMDRDGIPDLVVAFVMHRCGDVVVYHGDGRGGFAAVPATAAPRTLFGDKIQIVDANGDGIPDVFASCTNFGNNIELGIGRGDGTFVGTGFHMVGSYGYGNFALAADFDNDGKLDVIANSSAGSFFFKGDGTGALAPEVDFPFPQPVLAADFDGDGLIDIVTGLGRPSRLEIRLGTGGTLGSAEATFVVPVLLDRAGANGASFTSELSITDRGPSWAIIDAAFFDGLSTYILTGITALQAGQQQISRDLPALGLPVPSTRPWLGTLRLDVSGLSSPDDFSALARIRSTSSHAEFGGVAFPAFPISSALSTPSAVGWLLETAEDRSNIGLLNASLDDDATFRVTVFSTDAAHPGSAVLPDVPAGRFRFTQIDRVLAVSGLGASSGWARVERVGGGPYWTYGVVNDNANADGSIVPPLAAGSRVSQRQLILPVLVETGTFTSELVVTNTSTVTKSVRFEWVADAIEAADHTARFSADLAAGEQLYAPSFVAWLRAKATPGIGPPGPTYAGALFVTVAGGDAEGLFVGARISAAGRVGRYGVFCSASAANETAAESAWIYGLRQDAESRSNLALVNAGLAAGGADADTFDIDLYDGIDGRLATTISGVQVEARGWKQLTTILAPYQLSNAYARIRRTSGSSPFLAYAVVNEGAGPGLGTGDGSFIPMNVR